MLEEFLVAQRTTEPFRRWFADEHFDLVVWTSETGAIVAFELSYGKPRFERALTWSHEDGYGHFRIDSGEESPTKSRTPILVSDGSFPKVQVIADLTEASVAIDPTVRAFVVTKLEESPS
jgi:hypothetical protein